jgi:sodium transport system ATP-binding protein
VIEVEGLTKRFGQVEAVSDVTFVAPDGRITGLLGPNGAGKSTTLRIIATVLRPDAGHARIDGVDASRDSLEARRRLGVLPHATGLYPNLTARENIEFYGRLHGIDDGPLRERVAELIDLLELDEVAERRAKGYSQGQRIKVALARALVSEPQNVILDEPTNGLDVMSIRALRALIGRLRDAGRCVLFSSHVMQEVAALCDEVVIVGHGRVVAHGTPQRILADSGAATLEDAFVRAVEMQAGPR